MRITKGLISTVKIQSVFLFHCIILLVIEVAGKLNGKTTLVMSRNVCLITKGYIQRRKYLRQVLGSARVKTGTGFLHRDEDFKASSIHGHFSLET